MKSHCDFFRKWSDTIAVEVNISGYTLEEPCPLIDASLLVDDEPRRISTTHGIRLKGEVAAGRCFERDSDFMESKPCFKGHHRNNEQ